jgi:hypothetical protein
MEALVPRVCRLIETSAIPIPAVRRATLCESVRSVATEDELRALFMDAVVGSAFVPDDRKDALALLVLDGQVRIALSAFAPHVRLALSTCALWTRTPRTLYMCSMDTYASHSLHVLHAHG